MANVGRPPKGENRLEKLADRCRRLPSVRILLLELAKRGFTPSTLADATHMDRKALYDLVEAESPRAATLQRLAGVLGLPSHVGRTLRDEQTPRDREEVRDEIRHLIRIHCHNFESAISDVDAALDSLSDNARRRILRSYALAQCGLVHQKGGWDSWVSSSYADQLLPSGLRSLNAKLRAAGVNVRIHERLDTKTIEAWRGAEANAAMHWLRRTLLLDDVAMARLREVIIHAGPFESYDARQFYGACDEAIKSFRAALPLGSKRIKNVEIADEVGAKMRTLRRRPLKKSIK